MRAAAALICTLVCLTDCSPGAAAPTAGAAALEDGALFRVRAKSGLRIRAHPRTNSVMKGIVPDGIVLEAERSTRAFDSHMGRHGRWSLVRWRGIDGWGFAGLFGGVIAAPGTFVSPEEPEVGGKGVKVVRSGQDLVFVPGPESCLHGLGPVRLTEAVRFALPRPRHESPQLDEGHYLNSDRTIRLFFQHRDLLLVRYRSTAGIPQGYRCRTDVVYFVRPVSHGAQRVTLPEWYCRAKECVALSPRKGELFLRTGGRAEGAIIPWTNEPDLFALHRVGRDLFSYRLMTGEEECVRLHRPGLEFFRCKGGRKNGPATSFTE